MGMSAEQMAELQRQMAEAGGKTNDLLQGLSKQAQENIESQLKLTAKDMANRLKIAAMQNGTARENIAAQTQTEREKLQLGYEQLRQLGVPQLELDRWKAQKAAEIQQAALDLDREQFAWERDKDQQTIEFEKSKWNQTYGLQVEQFGFDKEKFNATLGFQREQAAFEQQMATRQQGEDEYQFRARQGLLERQQRASEQQYQQTWGEDRRRFDVQQTGYVTTPGLALSHDQENRLAQIREVELTRPLTGTEAQEKAYFEGVLNGTVGGNRQSTLAREEFETNAAQRAHEFETTTALDIAKTGASMGGPGDWANFLDYTEGVQNAGDAPMYVKRLLGLDGGAGGGTAVGAAPPARTLAGVASRLAGVPQQAVQAAGAGVPQTGVDPMAGTPEGAAQQAASLVRANPPSTGAGWNGRDLQVLKGIEALYANPGKSQGYGSLSEDQKAFLEGGAKKLGFSRNTFEDQERKTRYGGGSVRAA